MSTREPERPHALMATLTANCLAAITTEAGDFSDGRETGGILLGTFDALAGYHVCHVGSPGPAAIRQPRFFLRDLAHAQRLAADAWERDRSQWIGEWHTHPHGPDQPSPTDLGTYRRLLTDPELAFTAILSIIATPDREDRWRLAGWSVTSRTAVTTPLTITSRGS